MSKQIKVITKKQQELSSIERTILFNTLKKSVKGIDSVHYDNFNDMEDNKKIFKDTNILTLLLKSIEEFIIPRDTKCDTDCFTWQVNKPVLTIEGDSIPSNTNLSTKEIQFLSDGKDYLKKKIENVKFVSPLDNIKAVRKLIEYAKYYYNTTLKLTPLPKIEVIDVLPKLSLDPLEKEKGEQSNTLSKYVYGILNTYKPPSDLGIPHISILFDIHQNRLSEVKLLQKLDNKEDYNIRIKEIEDRISIDKANNDLFLKEQKSKTEVTIKNNLSKSKFNKKYYNLNPKDAKKIDILFNRKLEHMSQISYNKCVHLKWISNIDKYWPLLKKNTKSGYGILECKLCNTSSICSHEFVKRENKPSEVESIYRNKYVDNVDSNDMYYCKFCGAGLIKLSLESFSKFKDGEFIMRNQTRDSLSVFIYSTVRRIINSYINIIVSININNLIRDVVENCYPYVQDILFKYKKLSDETVEIIKNLYSSIYGIAGITVFMNANPGVLSWSSSVKIGGLRPQNKSKMNVIKAVGLIKHNNKPALRTLPMISIATVGSVFTTAMKNLLGLSEGTYVDSLPVEFLINSPLYAYAYSIVKKYKPNVKFTDISKVLNVNSLADIKKMPNLYYKFDFNKKPWHGATEYSYDSFKHFYNYVKNNMYNQYAYNNDSFINHNKEYKRLKALEDKLLKKHYDVMIKELYVSKNDKEYTYKNVDLSKIFCNSGQKHKFNIYVYSKGKSDNSTTFEVSSKNVKEYVMNTDKNKLLRASKIIDVKCSKCNTLLSETKDKGITDTLNKIDKKKSFFILYSTKCPSKFIHKFKDDVCEYCGVSIDDISNKKEEYFKKYEKDFDKYIEKLYVKYSLPKITPIVYSKINNKADNKTDDNIKKLADVLSIEFTKLSSIGKISKYDSYNEMNRLLAIKKYSLLFLITYEKYRNGTIKEDISTIDSIDTQKLPIVDNFTKNYNYYVSLAGNEIDKSIPQRLLNELCSNLLKIYNTNETGKHIIKKIVNNILSIEDNIPLSTEGFNTDFIKSDSKDFDKSESTIDEEDDDDTDDENATDGFSMNALDVENEQDYDEDADDDD